MKQIVFESELAPLVASSQSHSSRFHSVNELFNSNSCERLQYFGLVNLNQWNELWGGMNSDEVTTKCSFLGTFCCIVLHVRYIAPVESNPSLSTPSRVGVGSFIYRSNPSKGNESSRKSRGERMKYSGRKKKGTIFNFPYSTVSKFVFDLSLARGLYSMERKTVSYSRTTEVLPFFSSPTPPCFPFTHLPHSVRLVFFFLFIFPIGYPESCFRNFRLWNYRRPRSYFFLCRTFCAFFCHPRRHEVEATRLHGELFRTCGTRFMF